MNFDKETGLIPAIIQDNVTGVVLMLGYMNNEAFEKTISSGRVTFWSRSKKRLWEKGETSGHFLELKDWSLDCDDDALLIKVIPKGPVCHTGADTCWKEDNKHLPLHFLSRLEEIIEDRLVDRRKNSYVSNLFDKGTNKIAQKVGEEATELIIEAMDENDDLFLNEAADLLFHYLILLKDRRMSLENVVNVLANRHTSDETKR